MKKRLLLILTIGISFAPVVFAGESPFSYSEAMEHQVATQVGAPGEMDSERLAHGPSSLFTCNRSGITFNKTTGVVVDGAADQGARHSTHAMSAQRD